MYSERNQRLHQPCPSYQYSPPVHLYLDFTWNSHYSDQNVQLGKIRPFYEVSRNSISNWTWKFQLSILKNKKVLFLKKIFFWPLSISKQKSFVYWLNFLEGFGSWYQKNIFPEFTHLYIYLDCVRKSLWSATTLDTLLTKLYSNTYVTGLRLHQAI